MSAGVGVRTFTDRRSAFDEADALVVESIVAGREMLGAPIVTGLCGAQGSGKSTTALRLAKRLEKAELAVAVLSLDDFYLTRDERTALSRDVHPLLQTRGVPGTHDVGMACATLDALVGDVGLVAVPVFDKAADDRARRAEWPRYSAPLDVVLFEGWCVGARPMPDDGLEPPINALEHQEDSDGEWRRHVNAALGAAYRDLFRRLDLLVLLRAPSFESVHAWRTEQERGLLRSSESARPVMDEIAMTRFISHYERLTRWILTDEPTDLVIDVDADRTPLRCRPGRRGP